MKASQLKIGLHTNSRKEAMKLYSHLQPREASAIILLANQGLSKYKISQKTGLSKGKIQRCLSNAITKKVKARTNKQWLGPFVEVSYNFKLWLDLRDQHVAHRAFEYAKHAETIYLPFVHFCHKLYQTKILGRCIKRSADEFIKEFKKAYPHESCPSRDWVYKMARSPHYEFDVKWLPSTKSRKYRLKSDDEQLKATKYNIIDKREDKALLRSKPGNFEIDSVIGKRTDKQALLSLIDLHTGKFYIRLYNRTMQGFRNALKELMLINDIRINTLTMDNGGENNLLHEIVDVSKLYNCHAYCSGEKGTLENKHRILRRVIPKSVSMDIYSPEDIEVVAKFVNSYFSKRFNQI